MRSAKRPIAASARSISSPAVVSQGRGSAASASFHTGEPSVKLSNSGASAATHPATSGSSPRPACSPISRAATSSPARWRCNAASIATCTIRIESGIASAAARRSGPLPSQRSVRYARLAVTAAGVPVCSASISATSQLAATAGRDNRTIRGKRCAICSARAGPEPSGSGRARIRPAIAARLDPYISGLKCSVIEPPNTSAARCASVVQPAWDSRLP